MPIHREIRHKTLKRIAAVAALAGAVVCVLNVTGCTTVSNDLDTKKLSPKDRVYVGRIFVNFGGNTQPKCEIYVNIDLVPALKLADDNWVFYRTDRVEPQFTRIACYHESSMYYAAWHMQDLKVSKLPQTNSPVEAVYFGDIHIDWKIDDKDTVAAAEQAPFDETSPKRIGTVKNSGEIHVTIESHLPDAIKVLKDRGSSLELHENLIHVE